MNHYNMSEPLDHIAFHQAQWDKLRTQGSPVIVTNLETNVKFEVFLTPEDGWSQARGADATLFVGFGYGKGTRPAKLTKTTLWVGMDEAPTADGTDSIIVWEKWNIRLPKGYVL